MPKEAKKYRQVSIAQVKLKNPGDKIEGFIRAKNTVQMSKGPALEVVLTHLDSYGYDVLESVILGISGQRIMETLELGEEVRITLTGQENTLAGNRVNLYKIEVAEKG